MSSSDSATEYSSSSSSSTADDNGGWPTFLKCYVCRDIFKKPRILPCGHTFCASCLLHLRDAVSKEFHTSNPLGHRRGEGGVLVCPMPDCDYSMKAMNLCRWSLKNRTAADAARQLQKRLQSRREKTTQTTISMAAHLLSIPQLFGTSTGSSSETPQISLLDQVARALYDTGMVTGTYIPRDICGWKSLASVCSLSILMDVIK